MSQEDALGEFMANSSGRSLAMAFDLTLAAGAHARATTATTTTSTLGAAAAVPVACWLRRNASVIARSGIVGGSN